jgi:hypothetical protein
VQVFIVAISQYDEYPPLASAAARVSQIREFFRNAYGLTDEQFHIYADFLPYGGPGAWTRHTCMSLPRQYSTAGEKRPIRHISVCIESWKGSALNEIW